MRATSSGRVGYSILRPTRSIAGVNMSEGEALTFGPVYSATKVISETVAMLPWRAHELEGDQRKLLAGSKLDVILHRAPNPESTAFVFREYLVASALLWGNGYAEIEFNNAGEVIGLWPLHPSRVQPKRSQSGALVYEVTSDEPGQPVTIPAKQMFHLRGPTQDGIVGRSVISLARESWGLGIAAERFGAAYFGNGGVPSVVIVETEEAEGNLSQEAIKNLTNTFDKKHSNYRKAGRTGFLEKGYKIEKIGIPHKDAQFMELRKHSVTEVARWFRVPPHKIGDMEKTNFSNIEQQSIDFVTDSIQPWIERLEQEADVKLISKPSVITKININGLLRGDSTARGEFYNKLWNMGVFSINDIRAMEDLNPIEGGHQHFVPLNMVPLDQASDAAKSIGPGSFRGALVDAAQRMLTKEQNAARKASESGQDMQKWAQRFYARHEPQMIEALMPAAEGVAQVLGLKQEKLQAILEVHCRQYVEQSLRFIADGVIDSWETRAASTIESLLVRLAGATIND